MLHKDKKKTEQVIFFSMEEFVPQNHILRKIENAVDFSALYNIVEELYCPNNGRPSIDPVVLFKMVLIQHLFGITSLRKTHEEISMNVAYRWFLGYSIYEKIPHFATVSYNFKHRFTEETIEKVFCWVLDAINKKGYLSPEVVFVDGTHIKANANIKKTVTKAIPIAAKIYEEQLLEEINEDRENHDKKPFEPKDKGSKKIAGSKTDPDSGVFHKGEHRRCLAYEAHTACDANGYILGVNVTSGNVHDSVAFDSLFDELYERFPQIEVLAADSAYKTTWIAKKLIDMWIIPSMPYTRPMGNKTKGFRKYDYVYDEYYNCVICPENQVLKYTTTTRDGYREFRSNPEICKNCPHLKECTKSKNHQKVVTIHIWQDYIEKVEDYRHTPEIKQIYEQRKETIERVFADAKEKHSMRYTTLRGLAQVTKWVKLKFACMNLKKFALHCRGGAVLYLKKWIINLIFESINPHLRTKWGFIDNLKAENISAFCINKYIFLCITNQKVTYNPYNFVSIEQFCFLLIFYFIYFVKCAIISLTRNELYHSHARNILEGCVLYG